MVTFIEEKSFFEHLQVADSERIHSVFFSWLFSLDCKSISEESKYSLIDNIFNLKGTNQIIKVGTEINNIDIFIETNNSVIVIENKIKSSQHSNQLDRYEEFVKKNCSGKELYCIYLSLIKEQNINDSWTSVSYHSIHNELKKIKLLDNSHSIYIEDYKLYLTRLISVLEEVINNPKDFTCVFKNGSLKKSDKLQLKFKNEKEKFIANNQLETIFQKAFLMNLLEDNRFKKFDWILGETRGNALVDFILESDIEIGDKKFYRTFIQLQGENIKFAFSIQTNYLKSKKKSILEIIGVFEKIKNNNEFGYTKKNSPKNLAYVSISKKMEIPYWEMSLDKFGEMIDCEIENGYKLSTILRKEIKNIV